MLVRRERRVNRYSDVQAASRILADPHLEDGGQCVRGQLRGRTVTYRRTLRPSGSYSELWTEVDVRVAPMPLRLALRPQTPHEEGMLARGLAVDLVLGDPPFDAAFLVEAAPADVARALLGEELRRRLLAMHPIGLVSVDAVLRLEKQGELEEKAVAPAIELLLDVAAAIPDAVAEADRATARARAAYRDDPAGRAALEAARAAELAKVAALPGARDQYQRRVGCTIVILVLAFTLLMVVVRLMSGVPSSVDTGEPGLAPP